MTILNKLLALASTLAVSAYAMVTLGDQEMGMVSTQEGCARQCDTVITLPPAIQDEMPGIAANGDVLTVGVPSLTQQVLLAPTLSESVEVITVGHSKPSMGSIQLNNIDLQGARRWTWSH